jgi:hypothetical protein
LTGTHKRGSTIKILLEVYDFDGNLFDPETWSIKIYDSAAALKLTKTDPTKTDVGKYEFYYTIPSDGVVGTWKIEATAVASGYVSIEPGETFRVIA